MSDYEQTSRDYLQNWRNSQVRITELEDRLTEANAKNEALNRDLAKLIEANQSQAEVIAVLQGDDDE